jgi:hypothetical protein
MSINVYPLRSSEQQRIIIEKEEEAREFERFNPPSFSQKLHDRLVKRPSILVGLAGLTTSLVLMVYLRKEPAKLNYLGRWRIAFQGFTAGAILRAYYLEKKLN